MSGYTITQPIYYVQYIAPHTMSLMLVKRIIAQYRTRYQNVVIAELEDFGKALILDGIIQSTQFDEYIYHESLVHPAMVTHGSPRRVLILGSGEGASIREVLKWRSVEEVHAVDIDEELIMLVKEHLREFHEGSYDDPRVKVIFRDAGEYVAEGAVKGEKFDVVIMDLTDPYGPEVGAKLYSREVFRNVERMLNDGGAFVIQAGSEALFKDAYVKVLKEGSSVFNLVREYSVWVPSFSYAESFIMASLGRDPLRLTAEEVNKTLSENLVKSLRFYNGEVHEALMKLSTYGKVGFRLGFT